MTPATPAAVKTEHAWRTAGLLCLSSLAIHAASVIASGYDGLYGQDPYAYYTYAVGPLRNALLHGQPAPPFFWPPGYPLLVTLGSLIFGASPLLGQWISLLAGSLVSVLTYALAREVWLHLAEGLNTAGQPAQNGNKAAQWVPVVAGLLTVFHPQLWQSSVVVMSDTTSLAAGTLGAWALARYARLDRQRWLVLSAGALAYAIATRWAYALEAIACAAYGIYLLASRARGRGARAARGAAGAALAGGAVLALLIGPGLLPQRGAAALTLTGDLEVYSWSPVNFFRRQFVTVDGLLSYRLPNGLYYALAPGHPDYFTPLPAVLLAPGVWLALRWRRPMPLVLLLAWPALILGFHAGAPWQNFRFTLAALPPLAVLVAFGAAQAAAWLGARWAWVVTGLLGLALTWQFFAGDALVRQFIGNKRGDLAIVSAVEAQAPPNAQLLTFSLTGTFDFYSPLDTHELWGLDTSQVAGLVADGRPSLVLLDVANVEAQWQGRAPSNNYHWLRDGPGLETLGQYRNYTLFRVR